MNTHLFVEALSNPLMFAIHHPFIVAIASWLFNCARLHYKASQMKKFVLAEQRFWAEFKVIGDAEQVYAHIRRQDENDACYIRLFGKEAFDRMAGRQ